MEDESDLVTATSVSSAVEAAIIKSKLESAGITCFVADEHTVGINPLYSNALGGVRIQVRQGDYLKARQILMLD